MGERRVSPLAGFGVGPRADRLYRTLLRYGDTTVNALAMRLGWPEDAVATEVRTLVAIGLVTVDDERVAATSPQLALARLAEQEAEAIVRRERELESLRASIGEYTAEVHSGRQGTDGLEPMEVHDGPDATEVVNALLSTTTGSLLVIHTEEWFDHPEWSKRDSLLPVETGSGRSTRSIYPASVLQHSEGLRTVHRYVEVGEEVRLLPRPPSRLLVFGREAVLVPVEWGRTPQRRIVIRTAGVVDAFVLLFELLWNSATPLPSQSDAHRATPQREQIMRMLAAGAKDETIARNLDLSLRTVRRRVAELMAELGADTRFQAGVEATRRHRI